MTDGMKFAAEKPMASDMTHDEINWGETLDI
jgi:hypothetical protein